MQRLFLFYMYVCVCVWEIREENEDEEKRKRPEKNVDEKQKRKNLIMKESKNIGERIRIWKKFKHDKNSMLFCWGIFTFLNDLIHYIR